MGRVFEKVVKQAESELARQGYDVTIDMNQPEMCIEVDVCTAMRDYCGEEEAYDWAGRLIIASLRG